MGPSRRDIVRTLDPATLQADIIWYYRLLHWDSHWYHAIVRDGYQYGGDLSVPSSVAFFPLYPLFAYAVKSLLRIDTNLALLIVANVAALAAALLFTKFVKDELGDRVALLSLGSLCFYPSSLFLSAGYSKSLCLAFVLLSFVLIRREKFVLAAVMAGLASGTRSTGIVVMPVILWEMWQRNALAARYAAIGLPHIRSNAVVSGAVLEDVARPDASGLSRLREAADAMRLSARGYHRVLRVARTLADLDGADKVGRVHLAEALSYRALADEIRRAA